MRSRTTTAGMVALALAMSACTGGGGKAETPAPVATRQIQAPSSTPSSATPTPSQTSAAGPVVTVVPSDDPLYDEAVKVVRVFLLEQRKLELAGGSATVPSTLQEVATGEILELVGVWSRELHTKGHRLAAAPVPEIRLGPARASSQQGAASAVAMCMDASGVPVLDSQGRRVHNGQFVYQILYLRRDQGRLKVFIADTPEGAKCPF